MNFDLNYPPNEGSSTSTDFEAFFAESSKGKFGSPIDVELIDDDVQLLSSPPSFPQGRKQSRKKGLVTIDIAEDSETPCAEAGSDLAEPAAILVSFSGHDINHESGSSTTRTYNFMPHFDLQEDIRIMEDNAGASKSSPSPPPSPRRNALVLTCPICLCSITNPCSTPCGHIFCEECIVAAIKASVKQKKGQLCPNCRAKLPAKKRFHRVYLPL